MIVREKKMRGFVLWISSAVLFLALCISLVQCGQQSADLKLPEKVDYNYHVKPILVQNCYLCHGPDPGSRKANLRLDTFEGATALQEGRKAIHPGSSRRSELVRRITHHDENVVMPPPESNLELSEYDIAVLKKWIDQGAEWKPHWSFIQPEYVATKHFDEGLSANEVDDFILTKLEDKSLEPAPIADQTTLIRRLSYILTGLPPTLEELETFQKDDSEESYEKMVDHYLNSQGFGERWARHWMDIVRYAETKGHEFDYSILGAWRYRDYLIRAFNEDVSYDQLLKEHLAGDLLDSVRWNTTDDTNESHLGTTYFALGEGKHSPVDIKEEEVDGIDNMIDVTSKAFQGLTVSCAKCHDHKFDPIPTKDYYALYGVMESSRFSPRSATITYEKLQDFEKLAQIKSDIKRMVSTRWKGHINEISAIASDDAISLDSLEMIGDFRGHGLNGWKSDGAAFGRRTTLGDLEFDKQQIVGVKDGRASSKLLGKGIYGALRSPNFTVDKDHLVVKALGNQSTIRVIIDNFQMIRNPIYGGLTKKVDKGESQDIIFNLSAWKGHKAYIEVFPGMFVHNNLGDYQLPEEAFVEITYAAAFDGEWPKDIPDVSAGGNGSQSLTYQWLIGQLDPKQVAEINQLIKHKKIDTSFPEVDELLSSYGNILASVRDTAFFMGVHEGFGINSHVFLRGNHLTLSEDQVPRGFLSILVAENPSTDDQGSGRIQLAEAMLSPENPLTARVMVNRIWHHLFGRGIVETVDNFGLQGKLPTHPELLDHLAINFREEGWSVKKMIKYIVMSNTFKRSVIGEDEVSTEDPDNIYLSHFPVRRLEAEAIRDGLLFAGGNLNLTPFGPPEPVYLTEFMTGRGRPRESGVIDGNGRRTVYLEVRRNFLQPMLLTFDRPIPFTTFGSRNVTNVPAQSLILMNDPFIKHQASLMANLVMEETEDTNERINQIYLRALSRMPEQEELDRANEYINQLAMTYDEGMEEAVWTDFCHSMFNLKEFIYLI